MTALRSLFSVPRASACCRLAGHAPGAFALDGNGRGAIRLRWAAPVLMRGPAVFTAGEES